MRSFTLPTLKASALMVAVTLVGSGTGISPVSAEQDKLKRPDGSWVTMTGMIAAADPNAFTLDFGGGLVTVEMDDWDWYADGYGLLAGDRVTVSGRIDDDAFENTKIEAGTVYVHNLNTYFTANPADEEGAAGVPSVPVIDMAVDTLTLYGTVTQINEPEFFLETAYGRIQVDTSVMAYNPLDDKGYQQLDEGDRVSVSGSIDGAEFIAGFYDRREIIADTIITLTEDKKQSASGAS